MVPGADICQGGMFPGDICIPQGMTAPGYMLPQSLAFHSRMPPGSMPARSCGLPRIYVATTFGFPQPCAARVYACPGVEGVPGYVFPPGIHGLSALSLFISGIFLSAGVWAGPPGVWQSCSHKPVCFFVSFFAFVSFLFCVFLSSAAGLWL